MHNAASGKGPLDTEFTADACVTVALATEGYPTSPRIGDVIEGLDADAGESVTVFHAGTKREGDSFLTNGGRVVYVSALGATIGEARVPRVRGGGQDPVARCVLPPRHRRGHLVIAGGHFTRRRARTPPSTSEQGMQRSGPLSRGGGTRHAAQKGWPHCSQGATAMVGPMLAAVRHPSHPSLRLVAR